jgi:SdrD B-like domain
MSRMRHLSGARAVRRCQLAAAIGAAAVFLVPAAAHAADVSGTVFRDYNSNGQIDPGSSGTAKDSGLAGITVNAYDGASKLAGTAVTSSTGAYTLSLPNGDYRVEVEYDSPPWFPSRNDSSAGDAGTTPVTGSLLGSDDRYLDASTTRTNIDFGLQLPDEFSVDDPTLYYSISASGPPKAAANAARGALRGIDYAQGPNGGGGTQFNAASSTGGLPIAKGAQQLATV